MQPRPLVHVLPAPLRCHHTLQARISVIRDDDNDVARYETAKESLAVAIADRDEFERQASTTMTRFQSHKVRGSCLHGP